MRSEAEDFHRQGNNDDENDDEDDDYDKVVLCVIVKRTDPDREAVVIQPMTELVVIDKEDLTRAPEYQDTIEEKDRGEKMEKSVPIKPVKSGHQGGYSAILRAQKLSEKAHYSHPYICYISTNEVATDSFVAQVVLLQASFQASKERI